MPRGYGVVYADGACSGNGQPGASAGYGVYVPGMNSCTLKTFKEDIIPILSEDIFLSIGDQIIR